jgi:hypothetical protein
LSISGFNLGPIIAIYLKKQKNNRTGDKDTAAEEEVLEKRID